MACTGQAIAKRKAVFLHLTLSKSCFKIQAISSIPNKNKTQHPLNITSPLMPLSFKAFMSS